MPVLFFFFLFPIWEANRKKWTFSKGLKMIIQKKKGYKTEHWPADTKGSSLKLWVWRNALKAAFVLGSLKAQDCYWNTRAQSPAPAGKQMSMPSHLSTSSFSNPTGFLFFFFPIIPAGKLLQNPTAFWCLPSLFPGYIFVWKRSDGWWRLAGTSGGTWSKPC